MDASPSCCNYEPNGFDRIASIDRFALCRKPRNDSLRVRGATLGLEN